MNYSLESIEDNHRKLSEDVFNLNAENTILRVQRDTLREQLRKLQERDRSYELHSIMSYVEHDDRDSQDSDSDELKKEIDRLFKKNRELEDMQKILTAANHELVEKERDLMIQVESLELKIDATQQLLHEKDTELEQQFGTEKFKPAEELRQQLKLEKKKNDVLKEQHEKTKQKYEQLIAEEKKYIHTIEERVQETEELKETIESLQEMWNLQRKAQVEGCSAETTKNECPQMNTLHELCLEIEKGMDPLDVDLSEDYLESWRTTVLRTINQCLTELYAKQTEVEKFKTEFRKEHNRIMKDDIHSVQKVTTHVYTTIQKKIARAENSITEASERDTNMQQHVNSKLGVS